MCVVDRHLTDHLREGHRELSRGRSGAEQDVGDGRPAHGAGVPGKQQRIDILENVAKRQGPAGHDDRYQRLAGFCEGAHELRLIAG